MLQGLILQNIHGSVINRWVMKIYNGEKTFVYLKIWQITWFVTIYADFCIQNASLGLGMLKWLQLQLHMEVE